MLNPSQIPQTHPIISVGIILPEDNAVRVRLKPPENEPYFISIAGKKSAVSSGEMTIERHNRQFLITINDKTVSADKNGEITLFPANKQSDISPKSGILVYDVISGRGFHWKKRINVYLPEKLIIRSVENSILLINELHLETYLMCVATSEMGADSPAALIEAQTIAARSWLLSAAEQKHKNLGLDACNDDCCQRYQGTTFLTPHSITGALNTFGEVIIHNHKICDARYSKSCGGMTESYENIWKGSPVPYLTAFPDMKEQMDKAVSLRDEKQFGDWLVNPPRTFCSPEIIPEEELKQYLGSVDENGRYYRWHTELQQEMLTRTINKHNPIQAENILDLIPLKRGYSGRITKLKILFTDKKEQRKEHVLESEYAVRQSLHPSFLYSSAFIIEKNGNRGAVPNSFILHGAGWGHGVGLCQIGALGMALSGYSSKEILTHYYPQSALKKIYAR